MQYFYTKISNSCVTMMDRLLMMSYRQATINTKRAMRLVLTFVPLAMLLVGSCKTSELSAVYGPETPNAQFRMALFPDQIMADNESYMPAAGYISRAQKFVSNAPESLAHLTEAEVGYLFGAPSLTRKDADARIWQYKTKSCVVDFYFYGAEDGRDVSFVDYRSVKDSSDQAPQDCLKRVVSHGTEITGDKA